MERGFLSQKRSGGGRGVKEKLGLMADKSGEVSKHIDGMLCSNSATRSPKVANAGLESFPAVSEAHGIHSPESANEENMNDTSNKEGPSPPGNTPGMSLYANTPGRNGVDVVVPVESIKDISKRFATTYGFFLGKRVAYPVVSKYVRNTWGKYGLVKSLHNSSSGIFSFQFSFIDGLNAMLENGPWFIHNNPLILEKWHPDVNILKEDVGNVLVWVKLHGVPLTAFSEDDLSVIATKLGNPLMLDSYTSDICIQS
ncbi:beta-caryophyllene synthase [Tanacetum coccineum]|uniref:Beta-caryophyllene synthase n=1 Tax=Tanacetum coccineum TaxID=301880 RepID=A0ABQ4WL79_9ASTR